MYVSVLSYSLTDPDFNIDLFFELSRSVVLVWASIAECLESLVSTWWENKEIVDRLNELRRVCVFFSMNFCAVY